MNDYDATVALEKALTVGLEVLARWTNSHCFFKARGKIVKINDKSVKVQLTEQIAGVLGNYPVGHVITLPRLGSGTWSVNNRIAPMPTPVPA